eukprot:1149672-Pelagomonas_calceolata.AAC.2
MDDQVVVLNYTLKGEGSELIVTAYGILGWMALEDLKKLRPSFASCMLAGGCPAPRPVFFDYKDLPKETETYTIDASHTKHALAEFLSPLKQIGK